MVDLAELAKHGVVIDPHDPDREEARRVGEVRRPEVEQRLAEIPGSSMWGTTISRTSSVIAIAKTPSENASSLLFSTRQA